MVMEWEESPFPVMCISPDFLNSAEYVIPARCSLIYPDLAFTDSLILLPYTGGDKIGENDVCFYQLQYGNKHYVLWKGLLGRRYR